MSLTDAIAYLSSLSDVQTDYHNHKETVTYTGAALYVAAAAALVSDDDLLREISSSPWLAIIVASLAAVAFIFVRWQLSLRRWAASMVWACRAVIADALDPTTSTALLNDPANWRQTTGAEVLGHVYPAVLVNKLKTYQPQQGPVTGERVTYATMALVTAAVLVKVATL